MDDPTESISNYYKIEHSVMPSAPFFSLVPGALSLEVIEELLESKNLLQVTCFDKVKRSRAIVEKVMHQGKNIYGINTGFGLLAQKKISSKDLKELQRRIVLSHAVGVGKPFENKVVKLLYQIELQRLQKLP